MKARITPRTPGASMNFAFHTAALADVRTPLLAVPVFSDDDARGAIFAGADRLASGRLSSLADEEGFQAKAGETLLLHREGEADRILLVGCGKAKDWKASDTRALFAKAVRATNRRKLASCAVVLPDGMEASEGARFGIEGAELGGYRYVAWKTREVKPQTCESVIVVCEGASADGLDAVAARAQATAEGVNFARDLVNGPPVEVNPTHLAEAATAIAERTGLGLQVFDGAEIAKRGMNLLLAVSAGSDQEPRFIHLTYTPEGATEQTPSIALVGKGITFDSGGYSLKPPKSMEDMKMDMAGAAAVLGAMHAVAAHAPGYVVHGIVPTCENLVNGSATKVADIVKSMNGKTVEIMNTDAEGRLILADALTYAERLGVDRIVDLATLTGACMVALGPHTAGLFAGDDAFGKRVKAAADAAGEDMWPLPLTKRLKSQLKSSTADMKNVGQRWGGAITAGLFLQEFAGDVPWVHLDIAGPAFADKGDSIGRKGGTGFAVMSLLELVGGEL